MPQDYWHAIRKQRLTRRRALTAAGAGPVAALLLAACGDGGNGGAAEQSGLVARVVDETKDLKRGGTMNRYVSTEWQPFDPHLSVAIPLQRMYSRIFRVKGGHLERTKGEIEGDLAESWEFSPDNLQLTVKLNQKAHFHPIPPVNGRVPDAQDIVYSYNRFSEVSANRTSLVNALNPTAPVTSLSAVDDRTILIKFAAPFGTALNLFGSLSIVPREAEDAAKLDLRNQIIGSGPWMLAPGDYEPSVSFTYRRNPGFGQDQRNLPYLDAIFSPLVTEYSAQLAQLKTGNLLMVNGVPRPEDMLTTRQEVPALEMHATPISTAARRTIWGQLPESPFRDERVRQAWSMAQDRDLFIDTFFNVSRYSDAGLPMQTAWSTTLNADSWAGYWLDPRGKDFGPNGRYYQHDIAEAKKLLGAAGHSSGLDANLRYSSGGHPYGPGYNNEIQVVQGMVAEAGFRPRQVDINFATEFREKIQRGKGKFEGVSFINSFSVPDPVDFLFQAYNSGGALFYSWDPDGKGTYAGDPTLDDLTNKLRREFDLKKRLDLAHEIQRYEAKKLYYLAFPGGANGFSLAWPAVRGRDVWLGDAYRDDATLWLDQTKPPFRA